MMSHKEFKLTYLDVIIVKVKVLHISAGNISKMVIYRAIFIIIAIKYAVAHALAISIFRIESGLFKISTWPLEGVYPNILAFLFLFVI